VLGTRGRVSSPSARVRHSGKNCFVFYFFCLIFFEAIPHYFKLLAQIWGYFEFFYISLVFFHFVEVFSILQI
jgi:hypothetical protein